MPNANSSQSDVLIVGSGPGGATLARQLSKKGVRVTLLERGRDQRAAWYYGTHLGAMVYSDRRSFLYSKEGLNIIRPIMLGGATGMYCGSASRPPDWLADRYGIELSTEVDETISELEIAPLPADQRGEASNLIAQAAQSLGYAWQPLPKFINPRRTDRFDCGAKCMLGCRCRAKWSAAEYVDQALSAGASLITGARVRRVLIRNGRCVGVSGTHGGRSFEIGARLVVLAAGGIGSARILQASGVAEAGRGMSMDTSLMAYGFSKESGIAYDPPMTWAWKDPDLEVMFSTLVDPWINYPVVMLQKGIQYPLTWPRWPRLLGVMIKLKDDVSGELVHGGGISKPLTESDSRRLTEAEVIAGRILQRTGVLTGEVFTTPLRGTHPSATVRVGELVDENLATNIPGLYVCDASVFPEALGQPTVLTIIALARRLAAHLLDQGVRQP